MLVIYATGNEASLRQISVYLGILRQNITEIVYVIINHIKVQTQTIMTYESKDRERA